jgi:hypothetical protein
MAGGGSTPSRIAAAACGDDFAHTTVVASRKRSRQSPRAGGWRGGSTVRRRVGPGSTRLRNRWSQSLGSRRPRAPAQKSGPMRSAATAAGGPVWSSAKVLIGTPHLPRRRRTPRRCGPRAAGDLAQRPLLEVRSRPVLLRSSNTWRRGSAVLRKAGLRWSPLHAGMARPAARPPRTSLR